MGTALPEDETVPETSFMQVPEEYDAHAEAVSEIKFLQETEERSSSACKSLATGTMSEINSSINTNQKMLNRLYTGSRCHLEGTKAEKAALNRKNAADKKLRDANSRFTAAGNAKVDFGRYSFSSLRENSCGAFYREGNYRRAKSNYNTRKRQRSQAQGAARNAAKAYTDAKAAAKRAQKRCRCRVQTEHRKNWSTANRNNGKNAKAWKKAKHMLCVLSGTAANRCSTGGMKSLRKPSLSASIRKERC